LAGAAGGAGDPGAAVTAVPGSRDGTGLPPHPDATSAATQAIEMAVLAERIVASLIGLASVPIR
jgi:hypothetical protein